MAFLAYSDSTCHLHHLSLVVTYHVTAWNMLLLLAISLLGVISFKLKRFCYSVLQFSGRREFLLPVTCPIKSPRILIYIFDLLYFIQCLTIFSSINHCPLLCAQFLMEFHLRIDKVVSIYHSPNVFFFEKFNIYHKDCLTYSGQTDRFGKLFLICLFQVSLLRLVTFQLGSLTMILTVLFFPISCPSNSKEDAPFHCRSLICYYPDWNSLFDLLTMERYLWTGYFWYYFQILLVAAG